MGELFDTEDPGFKEFMTNAHAAGFTQKQMDLAMGSFGQSLQKVIAGDRELSEQECNDKLVELWEDPKERARNYQNAHRFLRTFGGDAESFQKASLKYGNDPDSIALFAAAGATLREDNPPNDGLPNGGESRSADDIVKDMGSTDTAVREKAQREMDAYVKAKAKSMGDMII